MGASLNPTPKRTVAELKERRGFTSDDHNAQRVADKAMQWVADGKH